jgi:hypothetical protein
MKKVFILSIAALLISGATFAQQTKPSTKKSCCHKSCCKKNSTKAATDNTKK